MGGRNRRSSSISSVLYDLPLKEPRRTTTAARRVHRCARPATPPAADLRLSPRIFATRTRFSSRAARSRRRAERFGWRAAELRDEQGVFASSSPFTAPRKPRAPTNRAFRPRTGRFAPEHDEPRTNRAFRSRTRRIAHKQGVLLTNRAFRSQTGRPPPRELQGGALAIAEGGSGLASRRRRCMGTGRGCPTSILKRHQGDLEHGAAGETSKPLTPDPRSPRIHDPNYRRVDEAV